MILYASVRDVPYPSMLGNFTIQNYVKAYTDPTSLGLFSNTLVYALCGTLITIFLGTLLAWIITRTNTPLRRVAEFLIYIPLIFSPLMASIAWILLLSPNIGLINLVLMAMFGLRSPPFNIYSLGGMILTEVFMGTPFAFLAMSAVFKSMDPALEESARVCGFGVLRTFYSITLKMMKPALLSVALVLFILGLEAFQIPFAIGVPIGYYVFTSKIYTAIKLDIPPQYGYAAALSTILVLFALTGLYFQRKILGGSERYVTVTGKGFKTGLIRLGKWRYLTGAFILIYFAIFIVLPFFIIFYGSIMRYYAAPSLDMFKEITLRHYDLLLQHSIFNRAFINTVILAVSGATITILITTIASYITIKTKVRGRGILDAVPFFPLCLPGPVLAIGLAWAYLALPIQVYATIWILLIAYITKHMPYGSRTISGAIYQLHNELEEVSKVCGASSTFTLVRITLPLLKPALMAGWAYIFLRLLHEFTCSLFLYSFGNEVLSVLMFDFWESGYFGRVCAIGILTMVLSFISIFIFQKIFKVKLTLEA